MRRSKLIPGHSYLLLLGLGACMVQTSGCSSGDGSLVEDGGASSQGGAAGHSGHGSGGASTSSGGTTVDVEAGAGNVDAAGAVGLGGATAVGAAGAGGEAPGSGGTANQGAGGDIGVTPQGGQVAEGGAPVVGSGGTTNESGGAPASGGTANPSGGTAAGGSASGGVSNSGTGGAQTSCLFYTPGQPLPDPGSTGGVGGGVGSGGTAGIGGVGGVGGGGPAATITSQKNGFAGTYLADGKGRALYIYGADAPGDCNNAPITNCFNDCIIAWPVFNGEPRVMGAGLDDLLFGSIVRPDGSTQTTYRGWPLYYYKSDVATGDVKGQGVGKIWQLAQTTLPNIEAMRSGTTKFLGDGEGHALYTATADTLGTALSAPVSSCTGSCLDSYPAFAPTYASPVTYLNAADFTYFARGDGKLQLAYKGAPLYRSTLDTRSGTMAGVATGWVLVAP